ncbi:MAG: DEAD/DEAH box helicase family protein, partial [Clostridia bacterium]
PQLVPIHYQDAKNAIRLDCYADTLVYEKAGENSGKLLGIRFGGYPEQVRGMSDAVFGGGTLEVVRENAPPLTLMSLTKQYTRQISMDGVYAEVVLFAADDSNIPIRTADGKNEGQTKLETPPRSCYIFTPQGDSDRLFEEIDRRVRVPLIPQFKEYLLDELVRTSALQQLSVVCLNEQFDAWRLSCTSDDKNIIQVVENGLKSNQIQIPGAMANNAEVFERINGVSAYLKEFGVTIAQRIKSQFVPLFDPAAEPICKELLAINENIIQHTGYRLYDAQLAAAEGLKRKIDKHAPALIVAECGSGKTKVGAAALYASHKAAGKTKTFNMILCPSHVSDKWVREVEETVPNS